MFVTLLMKVFLAKEINCHNSWILPCLFNYSNIIIVNCSDFLLTLWCKLSFCDHLDKNSTASFPLRTQIYMPEKNQFMSILNISRQSNKYVTIYYLLLNSVLNIMIPGMILIFLNISILR